MVHAKTFTPSIYQQAVFDWQLNPNPESLSLVLEAVAGSGKTKTLTELIRHIPGHHSTVYLAFNSAVVKEMKPKVEALGTRHVPVDCKTMNSLGMGTWLRSGHASSGFDINPDLNYEIMRKYMIRRGRNVFLSEELKGSLMDQASGMDAKSKSKFEFMLDSGKFDKDQSFISRLVGLSKGHGMVPSNFAGQLTDGLMEDSRANWIGLIDEYDLEFMSRDVAIEVARRILSESIQVSKLKADFDSQLWLPVIFGCKFKQYDQILVDEAQDLNPINIEIAKRILKPGGRSVFVGDSHQAIYAFRGSLSDSMNQIRHAFGSQSLPLSICYRCPKLVVAEAKNLVPHIEHHEDQIEGTVETMDKYGPYVFGRKDIILCRNMMPLVTLSHALMKAKIPCKVMGRDFAYNLLTLIDKMKAEEDVDLLEKRLEEFKAREVAKLIQDQDLNGSKIQSIEDKVDTILSFVANLAENSRTISSVKADITKTFRLNDKDNSDILCLSTGHKAKGGEWDNVFFLDRHRIPSKYAKTPEAIQQERNLEYVMLTRAKKRLFFINLDNYDPSYSACGDDEVFDMEDFTK